MGVRIQSEGDEAVLLGDAAVHPALLDRPNWSYVADLDPDVSIATRWSLLEELVDRDVRVCCGHYPGGGIGRIVRRNGMTVWEVE
jgi:glyoxylase-like metal-dependent hydrolase (beta-lactamase superfamily II)